MTTPLIDTAEFKARVLETAIENPDLPIEFIEGIFIAQAEEASFEYVFDWFKYFTRRLLREI